MRKKVEERGRKRTKYGGRGTKMKKGMKSKKEGGRRWMKEEERGRHSKEDETNEGEE